MGNLHYFMKYGFIDNDLHFTAFISFSLDSKDEMLVVKEQLLDVLNIPHAQDLSSDDILKIVSFCRIQTLDKSDLEWSEIEFDSGSEMPSEIKQSL